MMLIRELLLLLLVSLLGVLIARGQQPKTDSNSFPTSFSNLNEQYQDSLKAQHGAITPQFLRSWSDRYWKLVQRHPNHKLAPEAARKALSIYAKFNNPNILEEKLNSLSMDDRAMSGVLPFWKQPLDGSHTLDHPYVKKLQRIAEHSQSEDVQIAAHYYLARWFTKFKYYDQALNQLNTLELSYHVYPSNTKYGEEIAKMRNQVDTYSAGKPMPNFTIKMLDGGTFTQQALKDNVTFIYFYGSHCGSCTIMYPKITELYRQYKDQGFQVVGVGYDWKVLYGFNTPAEFKQFAQEYDITWPQTVDVSFFTDTLNMQALSTGYLINGNKKIVRISRSDVVTNVTDNFEHTSLKEAVGKLIRK